MFFDKVILIIKYKYLQQEKNFQFSKFKYIFIKQWVLHWGGEDVYKRQCINILCVSELKWWFFILIFDQYTLLCIIHESTWSQCLLLQHFFVPNIYFLTVLLRRAFLRRKKLIHYILCLLHPLLYVQCYWFRLTYRFSVD